MPESRTVCDDQLPSNTVPVKPIWPVKPDPRPGTSVSLAERLSGMDNTTFGLLSTVLVTSPCTKLKSLPACFAASAFSVAPLNVPSLLGEDASELYAKNQYNLLALMMKNNVVEIDWDDEILSKTVLTHAGENKSIASDKVAKDAAHAKSRANPTPTKPGIPTAA